MQRAGHETVGGVDRGALVAALSLLLVGLLFLYSASAPFSNRYFGSSAHLFVKQLVAVGIGAMAAAVLARFDYHRFRHMDDLLMIGAFALVLVTILPLGGVVNGRWLRLGPFDVQPTEFLKLALIVYLACTIERKGAGMQRFATGVLPFVVVVSVIGLVVLQQPDLGMVLVIAAVTGAMLFLGGARLPHLMAVAAAAAPMACLAVLWAPYRVARLMAFLSPEAHSASFGYQGLQSLMAIGSGGILGRGLGASRAKLFYLPQAHSDFVFSVAAEETGMVGALLLLALFATLAWRSVCIARRAPDALGRLLALGIGFALVFQAIVNVGVAVGLLPVTGLTLPFVSHGGSSMIVTLAMVGLLLGVSRRCGGAR